MTLWKDHTQRIVFLVKNVKVRSKHAPHYKVNGCIIPQGKKEGRAQEQGSWHEEVIGSTFPLSRMEQDECECIPV